MHASVREGRPAHPGSASFVLLVRRRPAELVAAALGGAEDLGRVAGCVRRAPAAAVLLVGDDSSGLFSDHIVDDVLLEPGLEALDLRQIEGLLDGLGERGVVQLTAAEFVDPFAHDLPGLLPELADLLGFMPPLPMVGHRFLQIVAFSRWCLAERLHARSTSGVRARFGGFVRPVRKLARAAHRAGLDGANPGPSGPSVRSSVRAARNVLPKWGGGCRVRAVGVGACRDRAGSRPWGGAGHERARAWPCPAFAAAYSVAR